MEKGYGEGLAMGGTIQIVVHSPNGSLLLPRRKRAVDRAIAALERQPYVHKVHTLYNRTGGLAPNLRIGVIRVELSGHSFDQVPEITKRLSAAAQPARELGLEVVAADASNPADKEVKTGASEVMGVLVALVVLMLAFGTVIAAGVPIFAALLSLATALAVIGMLGHVADIPKNAPILASMIGLGVGIDYALFLLARHRALLARGVPVVESVARTVATSGGAVIFAGGTVVIALSGLMLAGLPMLQTLAWTTGIAVVGAVLASVSLVPAILGLLGHRVNAWRVPSPRPRRRTAARKSRDAATTASAAGQASVASTAGQASAANPASAANAKNAGNAPAGRTPSGDMGNAEGWARLGRWVARRPWRALIGALVVLGVLTAPALSLRLGVIDEGYQASDSPARRAYELISVGFGPGATGPVLAVATLDRPLPAGDEAARERLKRITDRFADVEGVAHAQVMRVRDDQRGVIVQIVPTTQPGHPDTADLVRRLRGVEVPGAEVHLGHKVAAMTEVGERLTERMPLVVGVVVLLSALLLLLAFRAPVVAIKAALMNLVSLGASFGALAVVFSWGLGTRLVGIEPSMWDKESMLQTIFFSVPVENYVPLMMLAVLFGLSMDYEVFLLTAVRQAYLRTRDNRLAVAEGLGTTGRVITSAALIMVAVFTAFIAYPDPVIKMFGVGLSVAIVVDATIIRGLLVPATMVLLGRANWWCPRWLDRVLPPLSIADHADEDDTPPPAPARQEPRVPVHV
ncbi:MMPL family transporter [Bailinhaonella thermotolerans]|uniref:MMPL family transporter n=2 Tax=Bailinhaonella thermotolerans TaxID=1070861 RepID=A0A3A4AJ69_9ACTN|nr:MMPL family transporter [Bailinhaonella thermotolerans]